MLKGLRVSGERRVNGRERVTDRLGLRAKEVDTAGVITARLGFANALLGVGTGGHRVGLQAEPVG